MRPTHRTCSKTEPSQSSLGWEWELLNTNTTPPASEMRGWRLSLAGVNMYAQVMIWGGCGVCGLWGGVVDVGCGVSGGVVALVISD